MPRFAVWNSMLLVCVVVRCFSGIVAQCSNETRPKIVKALSDRRVGIVGFQRINSTCEWRLTADEGHVIEVRVKHTSPGSGRKPCNLTDLIFYDGGSSESPVTKGMCFNGDQRVTSTGQEMLVQLPPAPLADKTVSQRWVIFGYRAYPCDSPSVWFRRCKTATGTTQSRGDTTTTTAPRRFTATTTTRRDTTTTTAPRRFTTTATAIASNTNNNHSYESPGSDVVTKVIAGLTCTVVGFVIFVVVVLVVSIRRRRRKGPSSRERPSASSSSHGFRPSAVATAAPIDVFFRRSNSSSSFSPRAVTNQAFGNSPFSNGCIRLQPMARRQALGDRDVHRSRTGWLQSFGLDGVGGGGGGGRRPGEVSAVWWTGSWDNEGGVGSQRVDPAFPPPPPYSSLDTAKAEVYGEVQDDPPPPPYTEAMKTAYPPAEP